MKRNIARILSIFFFFLFIPVRDVFAGSSTISIDPSSGTITKPFTVKVIIDGHGDKFNAAQADVALSSNLAIKDLTLGDCNFSYLKTPSVQDPSFEGIIIQTYLTKCIAYSMTLIPTAKGQGTITFSKTHIKRYGDAGEVFSKAVDGSYTLTVAMNPSSITDTHNNTVSSKGLYTLNLGIYKNNQPVSNTTVTLNTASSQNKQKATTDKNGTAHFVNLQPGIYAAVANQGFVKVGETIVNVTGPNHILSLAMTLDSQNTNPLMKMGSFINTISSNPLFLVGLLIVGIIVGVGIAFFTIKLIENRKRKKSK